MKVRKLVIALIVMAFAPVAFAVDPSFDLASMQDLTIAHIDDVGVIDVEVMAVTLLPMDAEAVLGNGKILHKAWFDDEGVHWETYQAAVSVRVPAKVPGFDTLKAAMNADVRLTLSSNGVPYAECMLTVQPVTSRTFVSYELDIRAMGNEIRPHQGACDIKLTEPGLQVGIPVMHYKDLITAFVKGKPYIEFEFLDGYCY